MTIEIIKHNPLMKRPLLTVLDVAEACAAPVDRAALEEAAAARWQPDFRLVPAAAVDVLVRQGAFAKTVLVNGEPYEGALEDVQLDDTIDEDAEVSETLALTAEGQELAAAYAPEKTLRDLFASKPDYAPVFSAVLDAAGRPEGASRADLEAVVNAFPSLAPDPTSGRAPVYPQYFIDALEAAGAMAWDGAWRATPLACTLVAEYARS